MRRDLDLSTCEIYLVKATGVADKRCRALIARRRFVFLSPRALFAPAGCTNMCGHKQPKNVEKKGCLHKGPTYCKSGNVPRKRAGNPGAREGNP